MSTKKSKSKLGHSSFTMRYDKKITAIITDCKVGSIDKVDAQVSKSTSNLTPARALWDTGASHSAVSEAFAKKNHLKKVSSAPISVDGIGGPMNSEIYNIDILLPSDLLLPSCNVTLFAPGNITSVDILIGMDIISSGDFAITHHKGETVFSFRTPSGCTLDFNEGETIIIEKSKRLIHRLKILLTGIQQ